MKYIIDEQLNDRQVVSQAYKQEFINLNIPIDEQEDAKNWRFLKILISKRLQPLMLGRPFPIKQSGLKPSGEVLRMTHYSDLPISIYPSSAISDGQKMTVLKKKLLKNEISVKFFKEYASVLNYSDTKLQKIENDILKIKIGGWI